MPRHRPRRLALSLLLAAPPTAAAGCTSVVTPPRAVQDPATVLLLREAMHIGVVLPPSDAPAGTSAWIEFGYGEWAWYAEGRTAWYRAFPAVLWPTAATLSRREWHGVDAQAVLAACRRRGVEVQPFAVERDAAAALRQRLETQFAAARDRLVPMPSQAMDFVPAGGSYWFLCTCADVAADWCRELGCRVSWAPVRAGLVLAAPRPW